MKTNFKTLLLLLTLATSLTSCNDGEGILAHSKSESCTYNGKPVECNLDATGSAVVTKTYSLETEVVSKIRITGEATFEVLETQTESNQVMVDNYDEPFVCDAELVTGSYVIAEQDGEVKVLRKIEDSEFENHVEEILSGNFNDETSTFHENDEFVAPGFKSNITTDLILDEDLEEAKLTRTCILSPR
jgi:hypothetical protein